MKRKLYTYKRKTSSDKRNTKLSFSEKITIQGYICVLLIIAMAIFSKTGGSYEMRQKIKTAVTENITKEEVQSVFLYAKEKTLEAGHIFYEKTGDDSLF